MAETPFFLRTFSLLLKYILWGEKYIGYVLGSSQEYEKLMLPYIALCELITWMLIAKTSLSYLE
jgi:uncharacterized membrane protein SirB2